MESAGALTRPRVALDARLTRQMSVGMQAYARELTARLPAVAPEYAYVAFDRGTNFSWDEQVRLPAAIARARVRLIHYLSLYVPVCSFAPSVVTIHDLIHLRHPEYFKAKVGPYYRTVVRLACARARRVITDDERTVDDLQRYLHVDPAKVRVVALGVDERFLRDGPVERGPRPYLLYAGNHRAHKNLPTLFAAWSRLAAERALDVYLTGPDDFGETLQRRGACGGQIVALGNVSAERLAALYRGAAALVQPALREGFGLPMAEAMASGCPVLACEDAVPQILRPAALTFAARDPEALATAARRLLDDEGLRARCVNLGLEIARMLTWDRCARATADVHREVLEETC